jgi:hypothetical protein
MDSSYGSKILEHLRQNWGRESYLATPKWGPVHELPQDFRVAVFKKSPNREMYTYATVCMSQPHDYSRLELFMFSPSESDSVVEILTAVSHYHRTGRTLGLGHTVNFGKGWLKDSKCSYGYISLPYLDGPKLECDIVAPTTRFLWLIPITEAERDFKASYGAEALEERFEAANFNYLAPERDSVA